MEVLAAAVIGAAAAAIIMPVAAAALLIPQLQAEILQDFCIARDLIAAQAVMLLSHLHQVRQQWLFFLIPAPYKPIRYLRVSQSAVLMLWAHQAERPTALTAKADAVVK